LKNYRAFFIAAVVCAVLAALVGAYGYNTVAKMVTVTVASRDILADELVSDRNASYGKEPVGSLKPDSIKNINEVKGMVAKGFIPAGTPLRKSMFISVAGAGYAARLGALDGNLVALALPESVDTSVGKAIKRGDKVTVKGSSKNGSNQLMAQKAEVLDIPNKNTGVNAVVLALSPEEADKIALAKSQGYTIYCELLPVQG